MGGFIPFSFPPVCGRLSSNKLERRWFVFSCRDNKGISRTRKHAVTYDSLLGRDTMRLRKLIESGSLAMRFTIALSIAACAAAMATPATAQQTQPAAAAPEPVLQEVVVTGSRIPVPANISAT